MIDQIGVAVYAAGFVLLAYLVYVVLSGLSGTPRMLRSLFGVSAGYFAILAIVGAIDYFSAGYGSLNYHGADVLACVFALAAFGAYQMFRIVSDAGQRARLLAGLGSVDKSSEKKTTTTVKKRVFVDSRAAEALKAEELKRQVRASGAPVVEDGSHQWRISTRDIAPKGALPAAAAPFIENSIIDACAFGPVKLVIDLTNVTSMDSAVVEVLVSCYRRFREARFTIVAPPGSAPYRALELLGVDQIIPVQPNLVE